MCPLRIILIFLSATLAGYFAWQSVRSDDNDDSFDVSEEENSGADGALKKKRQKGFRKVIGDGFWGLVDMASGRYLWRNLVEAKVR